MFIECFKKQREEERRSESDSLCSWVKVLSPIRRLLAPPIKNLSLYIHCVLLSTTIISLPPFKTTTCRHFINCRVHPQCVHGSLTATRPRSPTPSTATTPFNTMSLVLLSHMVSQLKNCSRARLGSTSIPSTKLHLMCCLALLKHGFVSRVDIAGPDPPLPLLSPNRVPLEEVESLADELAKEPWAVYAPSNTHPSHDRSTSLPPRNPAQRRIWLDLKYMANEPVIGWAKMVSKPTRRIDATVHDIRNIVSGKKAGMIDGLRSPGDCMFFKTRLGVLEARECLERMVGGRALFRMGAAR
jgi:ribosomal protein S8